MAKTQFESTEALQITLEPFINPTLSGSTSRIITGDTVTCTFVAPNASTGTVPMTRDATTKVWTGSIATGSFQAGQWLFVASSNDASNPDNQYRVVYWGVGIVSDVPSIKTTLGSPAAGTVSTDIANVYSRIGAPTGASISADIQEIEGETDSIIATLGSPAGASVSADIAAIKSDTGTNIPTDITNAVSSIEGTGSHTIADVYNRIGAPVNANISADIAQVESNVSGTGASLTALSNKIGTPANASVSADIAAVKTDTNSINVTQIGKWSINPNTAILTLYQLDGVTVYKTFQLADSNATPSTTNVFQKIPL